MKIEIVKRLRKDICRGCLTYESMDENNSCFYPHKKNGKYCPCSTCLIKSVCIKSCKLLTDYNDVSNIINSNVDTKNIDRRFEYVSAGGRKNCRLPDNTKPLSTISRDTLY